MENRKRFILFLVLSSLLPLGSSGSVYAEASFMQSVKKGVGVGLGVASGVMGGVLLGYGLNKLFASPKDELDPQGKTPEQVYSSLFYYDKSFYNFVGQGGAYLQAVKFIDSVRNFDIYQQLGARKQRALLIEGSAGNGKTLLAQVIAGELGCCVIPVSGYFFDDNVAEISEFKLKLLFDYAREKAKEVQTIILIDDIDAFAKVDEVSRFDSVRKRVVQALLYYIQNIKDDEDFFVVGTANAAHNLDKNLFKPGWFDQIIHIPLPTQRGRERILRYYLQQIELVQDIPVKRVSQILAEQAAGFSGALLKDLVEHAALIAGQDNKNFVDEQALFDSCKQIKLKKQTLFNDKEESFYYTFSEKTKFTDVIGQDEVLIEVKEFVDFLKQPDRYLDIGARRPKGLLLEGPSGCGKTLIARAVAGEAGCCFISVSGSEFVKMYVGTGAMTVHSIFSFARNMAKEVPVIIFIDEIDGLGRRKNLDASGGQTEYNNTINEILRQMDGFARDENIVVIGATNLVSELDSALLRPGRFDRKITVPRPTKQSRKEVLRYYLEKITLDPIIHIDELTQELALMTTGFSGAEIESFVNEAAIFGVRRGDDVVTRGDFQEALDKITLGLKNNFEQSEEQLRRTAYHEAGHTLISALLGLPVSKVSILSRGNALGVTWTKNKHEDGEQYTRRELLHEIMSLQGGFLAEQVVFGEVTPGVYDDLRRASKLASNMVKKFGMGDNELLGLVVLDIDSQVVKQKFDENAMRLLRKTFIRTKELLEKHKNLLVTLSEVLLEKETLDEEAILKIVGDRQGVESRLII